MIERLTQSFHVSDDEWKDEVCMITLHIARMFEIDVNLDYLQALMFSRIGHWNGREIDC